MSQNSRKPLNPRLMVIAVVLAIYLVPATLSFLFGGVSVFLDALGGGRPQAFLSLDGATVLRDGLGPDEDGNVILLLSMEMSNHGSGSADLDDLTVSVFYQDAQEDNHSVDTVYLDGDEEVFLPAGRSTRLSYLFQAPQDARALSLRCWSGLPGAEGTTTLEIPLV